MNEILAENKRLKAEVEKLISDNMELVGVIRSMRKVARERDEARAAFRELWQSADAYLPSCNRETIKRWRKLAGWEAK